jgi:hypothetical protein
MKMQFRSALWLCQAYLVFALQASPSSDSASTNAGGWHVTMSMPTNTLAVGEAVTISVTISNASSGVGHLNWSHSPSETPGFGRMVVTNYNAQSVVKYVGPRWRWADDRSGSFGPGDSMSFEIDLVKGYGLTNPGSYGVSIASRLRSPTNADEIVEFQLTPLNFKLGSSR